MRTVIASYTDESTAAVKAFNARLRAGGVGMQFPESPEPTWLPKLDGRRLYEEFFVALDEGQVRGAYAYKQQEFLLKGQLTDVGYYRLPLSEGLIDKQFSSVGVQMLLDALRKSPLLYSLGIGSSDDPMTKMLSAAGWSTYKIPFYFRVHRPTRFLRNIAYLRRTRGRRVVLDLMAATGVGTLAIGAYQALKTRKHRRPIPVFQYAEVASFGAWADEVWQSARSNYSLIAVRDAESLNILYPAGSQFKRLRVEVGGATIGWAVVLNTPLVGHAYFGSMRLGSIVDCLARPGHEAAVVAAAADFLKKDGADITIANLSHDDWCAAAAANGFLLGPSNFILAASKKLTGSLEPFDVERRRLHMMRADGDGPHSLLGTGRAVQGDRA